MQWEVVGVIVVLVGLLSAIVAPLLKLNSNIVKLTVTMDRLVKDMDSQQRIGHEAHQRLWDHNAEQDEKLGNHETRITKLESIK